MGDPVLCMGGGGGKNAQFYISTLPSSELEKTLRCEGNVEFLLKGCPF